MNKYEVKAYKLYWEDAPDDFFIGITRRTLASAVAQKKREAQKGGLSVLNQKIRMNEDFKYVMLGSCMVKNCDEKNMFLQHYIDQHKPALNTVRNHRYISPLIPLLET